MVTEITRTQEISFNSFIWLWLSTFILLKFLAEDSSLDNDASVTKIDFHDEKIVRKYVKISALDGFVTEFLLAA